jgi:glycine cleavage system H protein
MSNILGYDLPDDLYYHDEHTWVRLENGLARVGMTTFYADLAGATTYVDLPFEGDEVEAGETCGKIQSSKWVGKFVAPLSGEIVEINEMLEDDCQLINKYPYTEGWIMVLKPSNLDEELPKLYHGTEAVEGFIRSEKERIDREKPSGSATRGESAYAHRRPLRKGKRGRRD